MNIRLFVCALRCETHPRMLARHRQDDITSSSDVSSLYLNLHLLLLPSWARGFRIAIYSSTVFIYLDPPRASNFSPQVCFWGWGFRSTLLGTVPYPLAAGTFESMISFCPRVGYVSPLEGIYFLWSNHLLRMDVRNTPTIIWIWA